MIIIIKIRFNGAAEGTRTPDPIITNDVLYHLSYSGFPDPTMALLVLLLCREVFGIASHSRGDPLITNDALYQLSFSGFLDPTKVHCSCTSNLLVLQAILVRPRWSC